MRNKTADDFIDENKITAWIMALPLIMVFVALPACAYLWEQLPMLKTGGWMSFGSVIATLAASCLVVYAVVRVLAAICSSIASLFN